MAATINGFNENGKRISSQELLQQIYKAMEAGETEFEVTSSGHHNIGGPLWDADGKPLKFRVKNPGQRVASMGLDGTDIIVDGPAPADAGWLNAGATLTILGDGGDTTAHCAAAGKIFVAGRAGTRTGSLMKHDPAYDAPELWILKNTGSFSFEFMGGGIGVVCGVDAADPESVLGDRPCIGMVGGTVYVRGPVKNLSGTVWMMELDDYDREFLGKGMPEYLERIGRSELLSELTDWSQWNKIIAKSLKERGKVQRPTLKEFRNKKWVEGGIFSDVLPDDLHVAGMVNVGEDRLKIPHWQDKRYTAPCEYACPSHIPTQTRLNLLRAGKEKEALELVLEYTPFPGSVCGEVCPNPCMHSCTRSLMDKAIKIGALGQLSKDLPAPAVGEDTGKKVGIIGAGPGGLAAAWQLRKKGHAVTVYEADKEVGGKLRQVIPSDRLPADVLASEIDRIKAMGIDIQTNTPVDRDLFDKINADNDATIIACGSHIPVVIPFPGHEKMVKGLDFLKDFNNGERPDLGKKVVVIGAGNSGMDVGLGALACGAEDVTCIDIQRPAAYQHEIDHFEAAGGTIEWPVETEKITEKGLVTKKGDLMEADTILIAVGERPDLSFVPHEWIGVKGLMEVDECFQVENAKEQNVFAIGDVTEPGLLTHAIGDGADAAKYIDDLFAGRELVPVKKAEPIPVSCLSHELFKPQNRGRFCVTDPGHEIGRCISCGSCRDCEFCLEACPEGAIRRIEPEEGGFEYVSDDHLCIGCGICSGICPCGIWAMESFV